MFANTSITRMGLTILGGLTGRGAGSPGMFYGSASQMSMYA